MQELTASGEDGDTKSANVAFQQLSLQNGMPELLGMCAGELGPSVLMHTGAGESWDLLCPLHVLTQAEKEMGMHGAGHMSAHVPCDHPRRAQPQEPGAQPTPRLGFFTLISTEAT